MTSPNNFPRDSYQGIPKSELESAKKILTASGDYSGLDVFEKLTLTFQVARAIQLGGIAAVRKDGEVKVIYAPEEEHEQNDTTN